MPKYIAIAAITLDGKIAKSSKHISDWTSKEDKLFMRSLLNKCDVIIVGNNTYKTAAKPLSKRNCIVLTRAVPPSPFDPFGKSQGHPEQSRSGEGRVGERLQYCNPARTDIKKLINKLKYKKIAILGGAQTYTYCLQNNMLDEIYLTIEPLVFGEGINLFSMFPLLPMGEGARRTDEGSQKSKNFKFKLLSIKKLNKQGSLLLHYKK